MSADEGIEKVVASGGKSGGDELQHDERLFQQPNSNHLGDCPICCAPLPYDVTRCSMQLCCSKVICKSCFLQNLVTERRQKLTPKCPFCRETLKSKAKLYKNTMTRIKANDPIATFQFAADCHRAGDLAKALEYYAKAAELGDAEAHLRLAGMFHNGQGVQPSVEKEMSHLEAAALCGHPIARHTLGSHEMMKGNIERGMKHYIIASNQGNKMSMTSVMDGFRQGYVTKEELAATLRTHKNAYDAMNTPERVKTEASLEMLGLN
mmetsp:Transcript_11289/g.18665  ORF Transcript_11289/g.18665 Transcript_11289/m.18665 type:complete len:264 (-) Transcript_11289:60-851(-)